MPKCCINSYDICHTLELGTALLASSMHGAMGVDFMLVEDYLFTGILLLYLYLFIIYIREISWKHDASISTLSHR